MHLAPPSTPTNSVLSLIPSGAAGIVETLKHMARFVREGKKNLAVIQTARRVTLSCPQKDYACEIRKLHAFVRDEIRYVQDVHEVETVQTPDKTLEFQSGDCDDKAVLLASLLGAIGFASRFVAIGFEPSIYEHVYPEVKLGTRWIALETTEPVDAGWNPAAMPHVRAVLPFYI